MHCIGSQESIEEIIKLMAQLAFFTLPLYRSPHTVIASDGGMAWHGLMHIDEAEVFSLFSYFHIRLLSKRRRQIIK